MDKFPHPIDKRKQKKQLWKKRNAIFLCRFPSKLFIPLQNKAHMLKLLYKTIASGFGFGYSPFAPGTVGAALACAILWGYVRLFDIQNNTSFQLSFLLLIITTSLLGVWAIKNLQNDWGEDPSKVVIDEMVGVWINLLFVPLNTHTILIGFILFRFFDIFKPLGIKRMEAIKNGWGVLLDDVLAGVYGNLVLQILLLMEII